LCLLHTIAYLCTPKPIAYDFCRHYIAISASTNVHLRCARRVGTHVGGGHARDCAVSWASFLHRHCVGCSSASTRRGGGERNYRFARRTASVASRAIAVLAMDFVVLPCLFGRCVQSRIA